MVTVEPRDIQSGDSSKDGFAAFTLKYQLVFDASPVTVKLEPVVHGEVEKAGAKSELLAATTSYGI